MVEEISEDEKLADIRRVANELGKAPTVSEYREHGEYSIPTVRKGYDGSFVAAREAAGVSEGQISPNSRQDLLGDIERVSNVVGGEPSRDEYKEHGNYALSGITYRFGSWIEAKKEAGVYKQQNHKITKSMLIEDMQRVDRNESGPLSQRSYNEYGDYTSRSVQRRFGSWEEGCQIGGVSRPNRGPQKANDSTVLGDIRHVADELENVPSKSEYNEHGKFSQEMMYQRFGSWSTAVRKAGFEPNEPGAQTGEDNGYWAGGYDPYYGPNWYSQRRKARKRDNYECVACGLSDEEHMEKYGWELEVHHIRRAKSFGEDYQAMNALENLITLCRTHHRKYEELPASECEKLKES